MKTNRKIKRRIRYDRILLFLIIFIIIGLSFYYILNLKISNIFITNNKFLSDQYIIDQANISNYPKTFLVPSLQIKKKLEQNDYIIEAKVTKKKLSQVYIEVIENRPLFYYEVNKKTILKNGKEVDDLFNIPVVLNYITDVYFEKFINEIDKLDDEVLKRISEIKFEPNNVDDNRFLLTMNDGNYVYINIKTFYKLNNYISIVKGLPNKKGILYLDYGNNFEIIK